jgi:hypothetical protein
VKCNQRCKWYPLETFAVNSPDDYEYDQYGVKHLKRRKHLCVKTDKEIKHHEDCTEYDDSPKLIV